MPHSVQNAFLGSEKLVYRNVRATEPLILGNSRNSTPPNISGFPVRTVGTKMNYSK